jgi:hypothetical protein
MFRSVFVVVAAVSMCALVGCGSDGDNSEDSSEARGGSKADAGAPLADAALTPVGDAAALLVPASDAAASTTVSTPDAAVVGDASVVSDSAVAPVPAPPVCDTHYYRDSDGDGFGDATSSITSCSQPSGYVADSTDCYDRSADAHPGQTQAFATDRGDGSFDYDCDGKSTPEITAVKSCPVLTADQLSCVPNTANQPGLPTDNPDIHCYEPIRALITGISDEVAWLDEVPACGAYGYRGILMTWSRADSYVCHPADMRMSNCR